MNTKQKTTTEAFKIASNWAAHSKQLKEKYPLLTYADLKFETGKEDELLGRIETRLNKKREDVISILKRGLTERV